MTEIQVLTNPAICIYRSSPGGAVLWSGRDSDHTAKRRKGRKAKKERKARRRSRGLDYAGCVQYFCY